MGKKIRLTDLRPLPERTKEENKQRIKALQKQLVRIQHAMLVSGDRAVVVFEGMDAAGKGGTIRRIAWALDPRSLKVWPIGAPNEIESEEHYLQRFWSRLPRDSQIAVFDRSWYGRVLVERVEKLIKPAEWKRAYDEINDFEKKMIDDGAKVVKFFLHVSAEEQLRRLELRLRNPLKRWKLSYEDFRNRARWEDYVEAAEDMFAKTSPRSAPWHVIPSDDKPAARVETLGILVRRLSAGLDLKSPPLDSRVVKMARELFGKKVLDAARRRK